VKNSTRIEKRSKKRKVSYMLLREIMAPRKQYRSLAVLMTNEQKHFQTQRTLRVVAIKGLPLAWRRDKFLKF